MKPTNGTVPKPIRVVLVDNDPSFLSSAADFLSHFTEVTIVGCVGSPVEALAHIDEWKPDVVVTDLSMPGIGGLEVTRRIKARPNAPRVVVLTVFAEPEFRVEAESAGADEFLAKEDIASTLVPVIMRFFEAPPPGATPPVMIPMRSIEVKRDASEREALKRQHKIFAWLAEHLGATSTAEETVQVAVERHLTIFAWLAARLSATATVEEAARATLDVVDELLGWDSCSVDLYVSARDEVEPLLQMDTVDGRKVARVLERKHRPPQHFRYVLENGKQLMNGKQLILRNLDGSPDAGMTPLDIANRLSASSMSVPIRSNEIVAGVVSVHNSVPGAYDSADLDTLQTLVDQYAVVLVRIQAEDTLRAVEQRYRLLVENLGEGLGIMDSEDRFLFANPAAEQTFGVEPGQLMGRDLKGFFSPDQRMAFVAQTQALAFGNRGIYELAITRRDGSERTLMVTVTPHDDAGNGSRQTFGIFRDVTERVSLQLQLRQSQKLEVLGLLAGGVAHDFNNLLTVVLAHCGLLQNEGSLAGDARESLQEIILAAERAADLTRQLLAFSRRQPPQSKPVSLNDVITNVSKMLRRLIGESILMEFQLAPQLPAVDADVGMMEQVLMNLAVNARDAMPKGGNISFVTQRLDLKDEDIADHPQGRAGEFVHLRIEDTGCGIHAHLLPLIFEPFFTTKEAGSGTGLGLTTVQAIVGQHRGWVEVESQVSRGSAFSIYLPASGAVVPHAPSAALVPSSFAGSECILLVEDELSLLRVTKLALTDQGYNVHAACCGAEAFEIWREHGPRIDLLITDLVMPGRLNGDELARRLRQENPNLRVLFMSGYHLAKIYQGWAEEWAEDAGNFLLGKPFDSCKLLQAIRRTLSCPPVKLSPSDASSSTPVSPHSVHLISARNAEPTRSQIDRSLEPARARSQHQNV